MSGTGQFYSALSNLGQPWSSVTSHRREAADTCLLREKTGSPPRRPWLIA